MLQGGSVQLVLSLSLHVPAGLFGGLAGQSQVGPAQLSAFCGPSSHFTLGAAGNDSRPTSARHKRPVLKGGKRRAR